MKTRPRSDALVVFGATGDLAYKKIFPALHAMAKRQRLDFPVIGVGRSSWSREELVARAEASIKEYGGGLDRGAFDTLARRLDYIDGDYNDPGMFQKLHSLFERDHAHRPAHYLAIPPSMFETVVEGLGSSGCAKDARVIIEKPFGRDLASARELNQIVHSVFP